MAATSVGKLVPQRAQEDFRVRFLSDAPGLVEMAPQCCAIVSIHTGPSARMTCFHGDQRHRGVAIHGDVEIIPWGMPGSWELQQRDAAFVMSLPPRLDRKSTRLNSSHMSISYA